MKMKRSIGRNTTMILLGILLCCEVTPALAGSETDFDTGNDFLSQCDFEQEAKPSLTAQWLVCPSFIHGFLKDLKILDDADLAHSFWAYRFVWCELAGTSTADGSCSPGETRLAQSTKKPAAGETKETGGADPRKKAGAADQDRVRRGRPLTTQQKRIFVLGLGASKKN